jgi:ankyrin repeat protein
MGGHCSSGLRRAMRTNNLAEMEEILEAAGENAPDLINEDTTADCCLDWLDACCHGNHSPLHTAVMKQHVAMATLLLRYGADVTASNQCGDTALHVAAAVNRADLCHVLLQHGADACARNGRGETPAFFAVHSATCRQAGNTAALDLLLQHPGWDVTDRNGDTLLHAAAASGNVHACHVLMKVMDQSRTNHRGKTPAQVANPKCRALFTE